MTAIVGIQGNGWALLAADSMTTYDDKPYYAKGQEKIIKKGDYIFAFAGDAIAGNIATYLWHPPKFIKSMHIDNFMQSKVLPSLREVMADNGYYASKEDKESGFDVLICLNGVIYECDHDYLWSRDDRNLYAIGSGGAVALGAIAAGGYTKSSIKSAEFAARRAIRISAEYNIGVGGDIKVISQKRKANIMAMNKAKAYKAYEKTESKSMKKAEMKKSEGKKEKAREVKKGMSILKKKGKK